MRSNNSLSTKDGATFNEGSQQHTVEKVQNTSTKQSKKPLILIEVEELDKTGVFCPKCKKEIKVKSSHEYWECDCSWKVKGGSTPFEWINIIEKLDNKP